MSARDTHPAMAAPLPGGLDFQPVFTRDRVDALEEDYDTYWGARRRMVMIMLCSTADQRTERFAGESDDAFMALMDHVIDFAGHCRAAAELADAATARLLIVGQRLAAAGAAREPGRRPHEA